MVKRIKRKTSVRKLSVPKAKKSIGTRRHFGAHGSRRRIRNAFVFTVVTTTPDETFTLPLESTGEYNFYIKHGDGSSIDHITTYDQAEVTHTYAVAGTYTISITGTIIGWFFNNSGDCAKYYETKSVGPLRVGNSGGYWYGCVNHTWTATDILDLTGTTTLLNCFRDNAALTTIPSINSWDFSSVASMENALRLCTSYNQLLTFDLPPIIYGMLADSTSFDQDLSGCDFTTVNNAENFLLNVTLSVANFNALILSWSPQALVGAHIFHGGDSKYTTGGAVLAAREAWEAKGWTITDGG